MKKVLSLAFAAAVLLLGCSADGFFDAPVNDRYPENAVEWSQACLVPSGINLFTCDYTIKSKKACDAVTGAKLVKRSECGND